MLLLYVFFFCLLSMLVSHFALFSYEARYITIISIVYLSVNNGKSKMRS